MERTKTWSSLSKENKTINSKVVVERGLLLNIRITVIEFLYIAFPFVLLKILTAMPFQLNMEEKMINAS